MMRLLQTVKHIRELSSELKIHASVLGDLQGPKIRLGTVKGGVVLKKGGVLEITTKKLKEGDENCVSINYFDFPKDVNVDEKILVNDGKLIFKVSKD